ncbi:MAG: hypothetical protein QXY52_06785 [Conexivisphaerales archaeon]
MNTEELQRLAELKTQIETKLEELKDQEHLYSEILSLIDELLKKESFVKAVQMPIEGQKEEEIEIRQLKRPKDGLHFADAYIKKDSVVIKPLPELGLNAEIPPFKSFYINKILEGMKKKDQEEVEGSKIDPEESFKFEIEIKEGVIQQIVIKNYRTQTRLNEIINTAVWTFSRMLEKA